MDNLETIMQDKELTRAAVEEYLRNYHCPSDYNLPNLNNCRDRGPHYYCDECWDKALKNQD